jgi:signal peptidase I
MLACPTPELDRPAPLVPSKPAVPREPAAPAGWPQGRIRAPDANGVPWRRFVTDVVCGSLLLLALHIFVLQVSIVRGMSMQPCLADGDRLVIDRLCYCLTGVERFDVVVLRCPTNRDLDFVKRVIALPGERVRIEAGVVFVDGEELQAPFLCVPDHAQMDEIVVPAGNYFVLGDNRPVSCDSREFGLVGHELLQGKVRLRFWPFDRFSVF